MEPLMTMAELRSILERGLVTGKWSIAQFNKKAREPVFPSREFLEQHPEFLDMNHRDMNAFRRCHHNGIL